MKTGNRTAIVNGLQHQLLPLEALILATIPEFPTRKGGAIPPEYPRGSAVSFRVGDTISRFRTPVIPLHFKNPSCAAHYFYYSV